MVTRELSLDNPTETFDQALQAAGIPVDGVSGRGANVRIDFKSSATAAQREQARQIALGFDWTPRTMKSLAALTTEIGQLSSSDRDKLLAAALAEMLQQNPGLAARAGVAIDVFA